MRVVLQRVMQAWVDVAGQCVGKIGKGLLVLAGIGNADTEEDLQLIANKIVNLRIFEDEEQKFNKSLLDVGGELLVVSQFTLYADCRKGRRPSFTEAAPPETAAVLLDRFVELLRAYNVNVQTGVFQAKMAVSLINYGPVTIALDSRELKKNK
ncbi:MAG: D-aminoacyl-tRNA deacylase [Candidatus Sumerlaeia bacterium]|nr:D-aminoacyl-tRNA deacylase [Candidatus Sumerlaeia bacterium]